MTKKDYIEIARILSRFRGKLENGFPADEPAAHVLDREVVVPIAHMLKADNGRFDYARFLRACGVQHEVA